MTINLITSAAQSLQTEGYCRFQLADATTTRDCQLAEGDGGVIINSKTGKAYSLASDPCVERGPHVAYNEAATVATVKAVKEFLATVFDLKGQALR